MFSPLSFDLKPSTIFMSPSLYQDLLVWGYIEEGFSEFEAMANAEQAMINMPNGDLISDAIRQQLMEEQDRKFLKLVDNVIAETE